MARPDSWMPFYWKEYWSDTQHLTAVEQCAYFNLLGAMWMAGGSLSDDSDRLQIMARVTAKEWKVVAPSVMAFFKREDRRITQKRLAEEFAKAMKAYTGRSEHIATVNRHRKQSPPTVTVTDTGDTTHNSQSPNGEKTSSEVFAKPKKRRSQISPEWMPTAKDIAHATNRKLDAGTISAIAETFRDHHLAKQTLSADFSANWRTWVANHISFHGTGPWPRVDAGKSSANRQGAGGVVDAVARAKAKLQDANIVPEKRGFGGSDRRGRPAGGDGNDQSEGIGDDPTIIESDDAERMYRATRGDKADDSQPTRSGPRHGSPVDFIRPETAGISIGYCAENTDNSQQQMVADLGGIKGTLGAPDGAPQTAPGCDDIGPIPDFMRRHPNAA